VARRGGQPEGAGVGKEQNAKSLGELKRTKYYKPIYDKALEILDSKEKIPYPS
jgi:hypothetical protein